MMTPMSLRIGNLVLLLARRVVFLMLFLARRVLDLMLYLARTESIVFLLSMDLTFLSRLRRSFSILTRSLSILTRSLSMHTCLVNPFLSFVAKCFLM